jgi:hypothetical protein
VIRATPPVHPNLHFPQHLAPPQHFDPASIASASVQNHQKYENHFSGSIIFEQSNNYNFYAVQLHHRLVTISFYNLER